MEDRYEIRGKMGQGGIGTVYRAFDTRMNREVAIKRIQPEASGGALEKATKQLTKEATALSSLQHPHIVTVYDVGVDDDGPYVVMELLTGKTIDEVVEKAPLTQVDFRELALQTQEAMIAAHDLKLVHRDIKPGNVMLNWLPSGKFQVKIVDFGLAKFTPKPSVQTIDHGDSVFGSIFFMAPEQFERAPLDNRTDIYAMGCVYYFALSGTYPFNGDNGPQVMAAHLMHQVRPLAELRPDLPQWICDWVMWQMNRSPDDRPSDARESLQIFLQNEAAATAPVQIVAAPVMPQAPAPAPNKPAPPRPRMPGQQQPTAPVATVSHATQPTATIGQSTAPQSLQAPGSRPSVHTATQAVPAMQQTAAHDVGADQAHAHPRTVLPQKARSAASGRMKLVYLGVTAVSVIAVAAFGISSLKKSSADKEFKLLLSNNQAAPATGNEVNGAILEKLLKALEDPSNSGAAINVLSNAKAKDDTNIDQKVTEFLTTKNLPDNLRAQAFRQISGKRNKPESAAALVAFANSTSDSNSAAAALEVATSSAGDAQLAGLVDIIANKSDEGVRTLAMNAAKAVIMRSSNKNDAAKTLSQAYSGARNPEAKRALFVLIGATGSNQARDLVQQALNSGSRDEKLAAIETLKTWPDDGMFNDLLNFVGQADDEVIRIRAFRAALEFLSNSKAAPSAGHWTRLGDSAKSADLQMEFIRKIADKVKSPWVVTVVENLKKQAKDQRVIELADATLARLRR